MTTERLIELYEIVLDQIKKDVPYGICGVIRCLSRGREITLDEIEFLLWHFDKKCSNRFTSLYDWGYYFPRGEVEPRIKLIQELIEDLKNDL